MWVLYGSYFGGFAHQLFMQIICLNEDILLTKFQVCSFLVSSLSGLDNLVKLGIY